jgi:DNA-directed RNA polymerase beta subunit/intein/homing endonuclease
MEALPLTEEEIQTTEDILTLPEDQVKEILRKCVFPAPYKVVTEEVDSTNENLPGAITISRSGKLLKQYVTWEGFGDHHIKVYDNWLDNTACATLSSRSLVFRDPKNEKNNKYVTFENLRMLPPRYYRDGKDYVQTPKYARENNLTYGCDWYIDAVYHSESPIGPELSRRENIAIGLIPLMLKSRRCILHGKSPRQLATLGEDPNDPGGYFIVGGQEKVVLLQEQLVTNRILLMQMDNKGTVVTRMTVNTINGTALIQLALDKETKSIIEINFPSMKTKQTESYKSINVLRVFRIFGVSTPEAIKDRLALFMEPENVKKCMLKLTRTMVDFMMFPDDIEIMANEMEKGALSQDEKIAAILKVFDKDLFPHLNDMQGEDGEDYNLRRCRIATSKINLLSIMLAQYLEYMAGFRQPINRDGWEVKRVEGAGRMMEQLARTNWGVIISDIQRGIDAGNIKDMNSVVDKIKYNAMTDTFFDSFNTSNWGVKGRKIKNNIAQGLVREGIVATLSHINTVDVSISRTDKQPSLRLVQNSQWGFVDAVFSSEGDNCLSGDTQVIDGYGNIVLMQDVKNGDIMLTLDPNTYDLVESPVTKCFQQLSENILEIEILTGKTVKVTGNHPMLTARGFVTAENLSQQDLLCVTYCPNVYPHSSDTIISILKESYIKKKLIDVGMEFETMVTHLKTLSENKLLNFVNTDLRVPILARMIGFLTTGCNISAENGNVKLSCNFSCLADAEDFRKDALRLGFDCKPSHTTTYTIQHSGRKFTQQVETIENNSALAVLIFCLGKELMQSIKIPSWIKDATPIVKREFLAGLMGGNGGKVNFNKNGYHIDDFTYTANSELLKSDYEGMNDISKLLSEFNVETNVVKADLAIKLEFDSTIKNILSYMYNIGFRYSVEKVTKSLPVTEYVKCYENSQCTLEYEKWCELIKCVNNCIYTPIKSITPGDPIIVYDYTTKNDNHTIICANGIVTHNCGILKNLCITTKISIERSDHKIIRFLIGDMGKGMEPLVHKEAHNRDGWTDRIIVNGKFLGWGNGADIKQRLIEMRRAREEVDEDVSVVLSKKWLNVDMGPSRPIRPVLIVDEETQRLVIDQKNLWGESSQVLLREGAMEYISPWEQEYTKIAPRVTDIQKRLNNIAESEETYRKARMDLENVQQGKTVFGDVDQSIALTVEDAIKRVEDALASMNASKSKLRYTHCELDPKAILGVSSSIIPWPNHNQAPRNTYQVNMGKQALGIYHSNHLNRFDGKMKVLAFPTRPMVETEMYDVVGLNDKPAGENCVVAFMAYPYTEEDAFVFKKEFLENGGFRIMKYITYRTTVKMGEINEYLQKPTVTQGAERYRYIQQGTATDPSNGLPMIGAYLKQGDCVIGKLQKTGNTNEIRNESLFLRIGDEGIVEKVNVSSNAKTTTVKVKLRMMRIPQEGDKFAPRNAQKGTIGWVASDIDLPFTSDGISPDIIVNPHCIPSRMTLSYFMELVASKHGAMRGKHINGSAFEEWNLDEMSKTMQHYGFDELGYETMRSGTSGKSLEYKIFMGPVYFQALKHHVKDKIQARGRGKVKPNTRQPPKGRANAGGLRAGEMERDSFISHGATSLLRERLMKASDAYQTVFCKTCGSFAVNDSVKLTFSCRLCGDTNNFGRYTIPFSYKLLIHLLAVMGINLRPEFVTYEEYYNMVFGQPEQETIKDIDDIKAQLEASDALLNDQEQEQPGDNDGTDYGDIYDF